MFGDVVDGPSPRSRISQFDKLSLDMKDKIRFAVSYLLQGVHFRFKCPMLIKPKYVLQSYEFL